MKIEWLVTNLIAVGSPARTECAILSVSLAGRVFGQLRTYLLSLSYFGVILAEAICWPIQDTFVVAEPLCNKETFS